MTSRKNPPIRDFFAGRQAGTDAPDDALTHEGVVWPPGGLAFAVDEGASSPDAPGGVGAAWDQIQPVPGRIELVRCLAKGLREQSSDLAGRCHALQARSASLQDRSRALRVQHPWAFSRGRGMAGISSAPGVTLASAPGAALASAPHVTLVSAPPPAATSLLEATAISAAPATTVSARGTTLIPFPYVAADPEAAEIPLVGGDMTDGVVRVGRTVRRPVRPHTSAVHAVLRHLEAVGFEGAPRVLGIDAKNREVLTYLPGLVSRRPLPGFITTESTLVSLAELQLRYHHAVVGFDPPSWARWDGELTRFVDGPPEIICHCDVNLENVIFRPGPDGPRPYAFIDFDLARPGTRLVDIIQTLRYWAPIADPADRDPALRDADAAGRMAVFCEAYGLSYSERARLVPVASRWLRRSRVSIAQRASMRGGAWTRMLDVGVGDRLLRSARWLERNRPEIEARLRRPERRSPRGPFPQSAAPPGGPSVLGAALPEVPPVLSAAPPRAPAGTRLG
jgi:Phosphotransferase enzyme family